MNCHLSRLLLAFRPNELAGPDRAALDAHLQTCPACAAAATAEAAADTAIRRAMVAVPVPDALRAKLHAAATATQGGIWRRKVGRWAGAMLVASLVVAVTIGVVGWLTKPAFSITDLTIQLERERWTAEETVNDWLKADGIPPLPESFEYGYYVSHGTGSVLGTKRPMVLFQNGQHQCRVYILRRGSVNVPTDGWKDVSGSEYNITTKTDPTGEWVYVIAYTSPTLDPFRKVASPVAVPVSPFPLHLPPPVRIIL